MWDGLQWLYSTGPCLKNGTGKLGINSSSLGNLLPILLLHTLNISQLFAHIFIHFIDVSLIGKHMRLVPSEVPKVTDWWQQSSTYTLLTYCGTYKEPLCLV